MNPVTIGIAGGTGAGKSTFVTNLHAALHDVSVVIIPQDAYYHANHNIPEQERKQKNYDHPDAIEWKLMQQQIMALQAGNSVQRPVYSMITCSRTEEYITLEPAPIILVEGILLFTQEAIRDLFQLKIFIEAETYARYQRVVERDMRDRGRNALQVAERFANSVQPMHEAFIEPSKKFADMLVTGGGKNSEAIEHAAQVIRNLLRNT